MSFKKCGISFELF